MFKNRIVLSYILGMVVCLHHTRGLAQYPAPLLDKSQTRLSAVLISFSGDELDSFGTNTNAVGAEVSRRAYNRGLGVVGKARAVTASSRETFDDNLIPTELNFEYRAAEASLGLFIYLVPLKKSGFKPYITAAGVIGVQQLRFTSSDLVNLPKSQTSSLSGFEAIVGTEVAKARIDKSEWGLFVEMGYRKVAGNLANRSGFNVGGITLSGGIAW